MAGVTPAEQALRDAFLAECWRPVREHHNPATEPPRPPDPDAPARRAQLSSMFGDDPRP